MPKEDPTVKCWKESEEQARFRVMEEIQKILMMVFDLQDAIRHLKEVGKENLTIFKTLTKKEMKKEGVKYSECTCTHCGKRAVYFDTSRTVREWGDNHGISFPRKTDIVDHYLCFSCLMKQPSCISLALTPVKRD